MFRTTFDKENKQWNGVKNVPVFNPKISLGNVLLHTFRTNGSRVALICADTNASTTFDEVYNQTISVAKNLQNFGCKKGELIFLYYTTGSVDISAIVFAALCLGCPVTSLGTFNTKKETLYYLNITRPKYVFCELEHYDQLKECFENLNYEPKFFTFGGQIDRSCSTEGLFQKSDSNADSVFVCRSTDGFKNILNNFSPAEIDGTKEVAFIVRSSGSTGMPKGIQISHASIFQCATRHSTVIKATDVVLSMFELFAISGVVSYMVGALNGAARVVNFGSYSPERFFDVVERCRVTFSVSTAPPMRKCLHHPRIETADLSSLKHYICGGERLSLEFVQKMNEYMPNGIFCIGYGLTETVLAVSVNVDHKRNDCVGQLMSGFEVKIVNDQGERLGVGEDGEICLKQPFPFLGYLSDDKNANNCFDSEGFFMTRDCGRFDENNDMFVVGRKGEMFKVGGVHVTPAEIEEFLNMTEGVQQSCMVPIPDPELDFIPAAVIVKASNSNCTEQSVYDAVANTFQQAKQLRGGVYFVDSLPMTESGKIARRLVAEMAITLWKKRQNE